MLKTMVAAENTVKPCCSAVIEGTLDRKTTLPPGFYSYGDTHSTVGPMLGQAFEGAW